MNEATSYVHLHVVNYEPSYLALMDAVNRLRNGEELREVRESLADAVAEHVGGMGLRTNDLGADVDYTAMIEYEMAE